MCLAKYSTNGSNCTSESILHCVSMLSGLLPVSVSVPQPFALFGCTNPCNSSNLVRSFVCFSVNVNRTVFLGFPPLSTPVLLVPLKHPSASINPANHELFNIDFVIFITFSSGSNGNNTF